MLVVVLSSCVIQVQQSTLTVTRHVKTSPVIGSRHPDGGQRLLARSAAVTPLGEPTSGEQSVESLMLERDAVLEAFEAYHARCRELLQSGEGMPEDQTLRELEEARRGFLAALTGRRTP